MSKEIERQVMADTNRPCLYGVAPPCSHPKCLEAHYDTLKEIDKINNMSHIEMCRMWRFSSGHMYFDGTLPYYEVFRARLFDHFGGFTPAISKSIGW